MVCFDTDFLVAYIRKDPAAISRLQQFDVTQEALYTTMINAFELYKGAFKSKDVGKEIERVDRLLDGLFILSLDRNAAKRAGDIHNEVKSDPIGESDLLIGSIALVNGQTVLTRNVKHFNKVAGLKIESW